MRKYTATEKKVQIYEIHDQDGTPLDLMNVVVYKEGKIDRVSTFIGRHDRGEYVSVGNTENLSAPGTVFSYSSYVREQKDLFLDMYIELYHSNLQGKVYTSSSSCYIVR